MFYTTALSPSNPTRAQGIEAVLHYVTRGMEQMLRYRTQPLNPLVSTGATCPTFLLYQPVKYRLAPQVLYRYELCSHLFFIPLTAYDHHFHPHPARLSAGTHRNSHCARVSGIAGLASMALPWPYVVVIYLELGPWWAMAAVGIGILVILITMRGSHGQRPSTECHSMLASTPPMTTAQLSVKVGDTGKALTRLAFMGNAEINGLVVEVKSSGCLSTPAPPCASSMSAKPTSLSKPFSNENAKKQPITNLS